MIIAFLLFIKSMSCLQNQWHDGLSFGSLPFINIHIHTCQCTQEQQFQYSFKEMIGQVTKEEKVVALDHPVLPPKGELSTQQRVSDEAQKSGAGMGTSKDEGLKEQNARLKRRISKNQKYIAELQRMLFSNLKRAESQQIELISQLSVLFDQSFLSIQQVLNDCSHHPSVENSKQESSGEKEKVIIQADTQTEEKEQFTSFNEGKEKKKTAKSLLAAVQLELFKVRMEIHSKIAAFQLKPKEKSPHVQVSAVLDPQKSYGFQFYDHSYSLKSYEKNEKNNLPSCTADTKQGQPYETLASKQTETTERHIRH